METNQQMQEMMEKLEKSSRQQVRYAKIQCLFSVIAAVCCGAILLAVLTFVPQVQQIAAQVQDLASQAQAVMSNLESVTNELAEVDLTGMVDGVEALVSSSQDGVSQALDKINNLDIESLNDAITDLSAVVKPLAEFFGKFS